MRNAVAVELAAPRGRVLVVDDEPLVGKAVRRVLEAHHDVTLAGSGEAALTILAHDEFDVVLCDLSMPGMSGVELHRQVAASGDGLAGLFVFLTGGATSEEMQRHLERCGAAQVAKPFDAATLRALVAARTAARR